MSIFFKKNYILPFFTDFFFCIINKKNKKKLYVGYMNK